MEDLRRAAETNIREYGFPVAIDEKSGALQWVDMRDLTVKYIISIENIQNFFEGLKEGKLLATKCRKCGEVFFPPQKDCPRCMDEDMDWIELKNEGTLDTLTVIFVRPPSFAAYDPYTVAIATLEDGVKVTAWLKGDPKKIKPGQKVKIEVSRRKEGYFMYEIVPVEG